MFFCRSVKTLFRLLIMKPAQSYSWANHYSIIIDARESRLQSNPMEANNKTFMMISTFIQQQEMQQVSNFG